MMASNFYNNNPWQRATRETINQANMSQHPNAFPNVSQSQTSLRYQQPYVSKWEGAQLGGGATTNGYNSLLQSMTGQPHFANQSQITPPPSNTANNRGSVERPQGAVGGSRRPTTNQRGANGLQVPQHF